MAQHLVDQSRGVPSYPSPEDPARANGHVHETRHEESGAISGPAQQEHHNLSDSMQNYPSPYPNVPQPSAVPLPPQRNQGVGDVTAGGQMCR